MIKVLVVAEMLPPVTPVAVRVAPEANPEALMFARMPLMVTLVSGPHVPAVQVNVNVIELVPAPITCRFCVAPKPPGTAAEVMTGLGNVLMLSGVVEVATNTVLAGFSVNDTLDCATPRVPAVQVMVTEPMSSTVASERTRGEVLVMLAVVHCA
jgi:hypothetical protein